MADLRPECWGRRNSAVKQRDFWPICYAGDAPVRVNRLMAASKGIEAGPSDPGRVADQVLTSVRGLWGAHILADADTLRLMDKMAKSVRSGPEGTIEEYPDRTVSVQEWQSLLARRAARRGLSETDLDHYVRAGALKLGLEVTCPNCEKKNWYGLKDLGPRVECTRCLQQYDFPQGGLNFKNTPWQYRVAGPYSVGHFGGRCSVLRLMEWPPQPDHLLAVLQSSRSLPDPELDPLR